MFLQVRHLPPNVVWIRKRPYCQLVENTKLQEDIEFGEF